MRMHFRPTTKGRGHSLNEKPFLAINSSGTVKIVCYDASKETRESTLEIICQRHYTYRRWSTRTETAAVV